MARRIGAIGNKVVESDSAEKNRDGYTKQLLKDKKPKGKPNKDELVEIAKSLGIDTKGINKAELEEAIEKAESEANQFIGEEVPADPAASEGDEPADGEQGEELPADPADVVGE